jgi:hypothetical protein
VFLAYIDPGTGWLALQALLATLLAIPFLFRRAITRTVRRLQGKPDPDAEGGQLTDHSADPANEPGGKGDA